MGNGVEVQSGMVFEFDGEWCSSLMANGVEVEWGMVLEFYRVWG